MLSAQSLGEIIGTRKERAIIDAIRVFACKDKDVEVFLKNKAIVNGRCNKNLSPNSPTLQSLQ
jgi:hypothetical protein